MYSALLQPSFIFLRTHKLLSQRLDSGFSYKTKNLHRFFKPQSNKNEFAPTALDRMRKIYSGTLSTLKEVLVAQQATTKKKKKDEMQRVNFAAYAN